MHRSHAISATVSLLIVATTALAAALCVGPVGDCDGDGVPDAVDNCPEVANPNQEDRDRDRIGDACDDCIDSDYDGFGDPDVATNTCPVDNCPFEYNPTQADADHDGVGDACMICVKLGAAGKFSVVSREGFSARSTVAGRGYPSGFEWPVYVDGDVCTGHADLQDSEVGGSLVALEAAGTAVRLREITRPSDRNPPYVDALITGGGSVQGLQLPDLHIGAIDTSGTSPLLATCRQAIADASSASTTFAALPPTRLLGDVVIHAGDNLYIDARGGGVFQIDSLVIEAPHQRSYGYTRTCLQTGGSLYFDYDQIDGDRLILNVARLAVGNCGWIAGPTDMIINVPGPGRRIHVGYAAGGFGLNILAPERRLYFQGSGDENFSIPNYIWARNVQLSAFSSFRTYPLCPF